MAFGSAPPVYTPLASPSDLTAEAPVSEFEYQARTARAKVRLQRYLIEIAAYTIKADFEKLNIAIPMEWQISSNKKATIMLNGEKARLLRISEVIIPMRRQLLISSTKDRALILHEILEPAGELQIEPSYALDLISSYVDHQCSPKPWKRRRTIIEQLKRRKDGDAASDLRKTLESLALLVCLIAPDEAVRCVLSTALNTVKQVASLITSSLGSHSSLWEKTTSIWLRSL
jgi:hypothetical protein